MVFGDKSRNITWMDTLYFIHKYNPLYIVTLLLWQKYMDDIGR